jgi:hypothetical protein
MNFFTGLTEARCGQTTITFQPGQLGRDSENTACAQIKAAAESAAQQKLDLNPQAQA